MALTDTTPAPWPSLAWSWADRAKQRADRSPFTPSRAAERAYERRLLSVAERIRAFTDGVDDPAVAERLLREYAEIVTPWARQSAADMVLGVSRKNDQAWAAHARRMGLDMRRFLAGDVTGQTVARLIDDNAHRIRNLVIGAADAIGDMARESLVTGVRAEDMARHIARVGEMSMSRARTIALTETSKASTALTSARAQSVGSEGYIWRTAGDGDTRPSHRAMEGKFMSWDRPPTLDGIRREHWPRWTA